MREGDAKTKDYFDKHLPQLRKYINETDLAQLEQHITAYDFDDAQATLQGITGQRHSLSHLQE